MRSCAGGRVFYSDETAVDPMLGDWRVSPCSSDALALCKNQRTSRFMHSQLCRVVLIAFVVLGIKLQADILASRVFKHLATLGLIVVRSGAQTQPLVCRVCPDCVVPRIQESCRRCAGLCVPSIDTCSACTEGCWQNSFQHAVFQRVCPTHGVSGKVDVYHC